MRTAENFVKEMVSKGRTIENILAIAQSTHWKNQVDNVEKIAKQYLKEVKNAKKTKAKVKVRIKRKHR